MMPSGEVTPNEETGDTVTSLGLFDGFEAYRTPQASDYERLFTEGVIALDANVLLNLYRYNRSARDDLLSVLSKIQERIWVPRQALLEFWRNRESVLRDPKAIKDTRAQLQRFADQSSEAIRGWASRVSLERAEQVALEKPLQEAYENLLATIEKHGDDEPSSTWANTASDDVVLALEGLLAGRVGPGIPTSDLDAAHKEGKRRLEASVPPGYRDRGKADPEKAIGDYLLWHELKIEARHRACDVLFVTGDAKEDWWRKESNMARGPRPELSEEIRRDCGVHLFMARPAQLLKLAKEILEVEVSPDSVEDANAVERLGTVGAAPLDDEHSDLTPDELERLCELLFSKMGYTVGPAKHDEADLLLSRNDEISLVECVATRGLVGVGRVDKLAGTLARLKISQGFIVTNSRLTQQAGEAARKLGIQVVDRPALFDELSWNLGLKATSLREFLDARHP